MSVETAVFLAGLRHLPPSFTVQQAQTALASEGVDGIAMADQLQNFLPPSLWTQENAPIAQWWSDMDSVDDAFTLAAYMYASIPDANLTLLTDSIRTGPAQLVHQMLTLADITEGRATFQIGAGEMKQCNPFGWKRSEGLSRLDDLFQIVRAFLSSDEPVSFSGRHWELTNAFLGAAKPHRPTVWGLGSGPRILDLTTSYADGLCSAAPNSWPTPEEAAAAIASIKADVERKGRDPEAFRIGLVCPVLIHEDPAVLDRALDNPIIKWTTAVFGRTLPERWREVGEAPATPEGWTYFLKMKPFETDASFVDEVVSRTTRRMCELGYFVGSPAEVAAQLAPYVEAGVEWISPADYLPVVLPLEEAAGALPRSVAVCEHLKALVATRT
jgi:phthiodiolone/phenolphthiodiolone dimycocerosates ketoreductase